MRATARPGSGQNGPYSGTQRRPERRAGCFSCSPERHRDIGRRHRRHRGSTGVPSAVKHSPVQTAGRAALASGRSQAGEGAARLVSARGTAGLTFLLLRAAGPLRPLLRRAGGGGRRGGGRSRRRVRGVRRRFVRTGGRAAGGLCASGLLRRAPRRLLLLPPVQLLQLELDAHGGNTSNGQPDGRKMRPTGWNKQT